MEIKIGQKFWVIECFELFEGTVTHIPTPEQIEIVYDNKTKVFHIKFIDKCKIYSARSTAYEKLKHILESVINDIFFRTNVSPEEFSYYNQKLIELEANIKINPIT